MILNTTLFLPCSSGPPLEKRSGIRGGLEPHTHLLSMILSRLLKVILEGRKRPSKTEVKSAALDYEIYFFLTQP